MKGKTDKLIREISKFNEYLELDSDSERKEELELTSKLVRKLKPSLKQRSYSLESLSRVDMTLFAEGDKNLCVELLKCEQMKIHNMIQRQLYQEGVL